MPLVRFVIPYSNKINKERWSIKFLFDNTTIETGWEQEPKFWLLYSWQILLVLQIIGLYGMCKEYQGWSKIICHLKLGEVVWQPRTQIEAGMIKWNSKRNPFFLCVSTILTIATTPPLKDYLHLKWNYLMVKIKFYKFKSVQIVTWWSVHR